MDETLMEECDRLEREIHNGINMIIVPMAILPFSIALAVLLIAWKIPYLWVLLLCIAIVDVLIIVRTDKIYSIRINPLIKKRKGIFKEHPEIRKCYRERHGII